MSKEPIMQFFAYDHLPSHLRAASKPFYDLAAWMATALPRNAERSAGLRKLLEAKDCAVRALVYTETRSPPASVEIYSHPACPFHYCDGSGEECKAAGGCRHARIAAAR